MGIQSLVFVLTTPTQQSTDPVLFNFTLAANIVSSMVQLTTILVVLVTLGLTAKVSHAATCMEICAEKGGKADLCNQVCPVIDNYCDNTGISDADCTTKCEAVAPAELKEYCAKICTGVTAKCDKITK